MSTATSTSVRRVKLPPQLQQGAWPARGCLAPRARARARRVSAVTWRGGGVFGRQAWPYCAPTRCRNNPRHHERACWPAGAARPAIAASDAPPIIHQLRLGAQAAIARLIAAPARVSGAVYCMCASGRPRSWCRAPAGQARRARVKLPTAQRRLAHVWGRGGGNQTGDQADVLGMLF
jgi:hypothetical protein